MTDRLGGSGATVVSPGLARTLAAALPLASCALLAAFRDQVTATTSALVLVLWIVAAAVTGDRWSTYIAAASAGAWFDFFLTEPFNSFTIDDADDVEIVVLLLMIGVAVSEVALWGYRQRAGAARRSGYLEGMISSAETIASGDLPLQALTATVAAQIQAVLGVDSCRFDPGGRTAPYELGHDGVVRHDGSPVDTERRGLPVLDRVVLVVHHQGSPVGHFTFSSASRVTCPTQEQLKVAVVLADQVVPALIGPAEGSGTAT